MGQTLETNQQEFKQRLNTKMEIATADWQKLKERTKKEHFQNRLNFQQRRFINNYPKLTLKTLKFQRSSASLRRFEEKGPIINKKYYKIFQAMV